MLKRIYADNYRSLVNFDCPLAARQLILGANGSGKSTLFDILGLLRDFCVRGDLYREDQITPRFGVETRTRWQNVAEQSFELDLTGNGGEYQFRLVVDPCGHNKELQVIQEEVFFDGAPIFQFLQGEVHLFNDRHDDKVRYPFDWRRSALATINERRDNTKLTWFKNWLDGLLIVSPDPKRMAGVAQKEVSRPNQGLTNFADWYRHLRLDTDDRDYLTDLAEVFAGFVRLRLEEAGERRREIKACFQEANGFDPRRLTEYTLGELSEGQRVLIGLYAVLHFALRPEATVCFDEPDNFVALREIQPWLTKVLDHTGDDDSPQILLVSHHPELINKLAFKDGLLLDRPEGRHTRVTRFDDPADTGLSAAELVARGWET